MLEALADYHARDRCLPRTAVARMGCWISRLYAATGASMKIVGTGSPTRFQVADPDGRVLVQVTSHDALVEKG
jgi:hypothetical protein